MKKINADTELEDIELVDYPYIGIGKRSISSKKKKLLDDDLERIIGG